MGRLSSLPNAFFDTHKKIQTSKKHIINHLLLQKIISLEAIAKTSNEVRRADFVLEPLGVGVSMSVGGGSHAKNLELIACQLKITSFSFIIFFYDEWYRRAVKYSRY